MNTPIDRPRKTNRETDIIGRDADSAARDQHPNRDDVSEYVARLVAEAPPISAATRAKLSALLSVAASSREVA